MLLVRFAVVALLAIPLLHCAEATRPLAEGLEIVKADLQDTSPRLSELAKLATSRTSDGERAREANPARRLTHRGMRNLSVTQVDPVVQSVVGSAGIASTTANFEGIGSGLDGFQVQSAPPDTVGDIGPNHYFQIVNFSLAVFSRSGALVLGPVPTRNLWSGFGGACAETNDGDATVRYDRHAGRWVIGQFSVNGSNGPFYQCLAVSTSSDPTGTYHRYQFNFAAFNDYPKLALWNNAFYFTFNMFVGRDFVGSKACAMDRAKMLKGAAATMHCFTVSDDFGGLLASDADGPTQPPANTPNTIVAFGVNELQLWKMNADFSTPANSYFTGPSPLPVAAFTPMCGGDTCVKQPGTTQALDSLADRLMNRLVYRRFADHESLVVSHAVTSGTSGGVRWYEIRSPSELPVLHQQGTYAPDSSYRFMSSIAMDGSGNIALGFAVSSGTVSPGIRYTGRLAGDALGTLGQGEGTIVSGFGAQIGGLSRFGDYSAMNIDPVDDCTFWYTQQYIGVTGSFNWRTRVGSFKFPSCGPGTDSDFTVAAAPTSATIAAGATASFEITTTVLTGAAQTVALSIEGLPTGVTGRFNPVSVTAGGRSTLTITAANNAATTAVQAAVIGTSGSVVHSANIALTITGQLIAAPRASAESNIPGQVSDEGPCVDTVVSGAGMPLQIPDNHVAGAVSSLAVNGSGSIATLALSLHIDHPYRGDLEVTLIAPGGTQAVLSDRDGGATKDLVLTHVDLPAFTGQLAAGSWQLKVRDRAGADVGTLVSWSLAIARTCATSIGWSGASSPRMPMIDDGQICSSVEVSTAGDAADVVLDLAGYHTYRSSLRATLAHNGVTSLVFPTATFPATDGVVSFVNRAVTGFRGSAAGTWTLCVVDSDSHGDTGVLTRWAVHQRP